VTQIFAKALLTWMLMMVAESIHGVLRELFLAPYVGSFRARQIGVISGAAIIFAVACVFTAWIGARRTRVLWAIGLFWATLTLGFEVILGRVAFGYSWQRILEDYDPRQGGWMPAGILWVAFCPAIASALRGRAQARAAGLAHPRYDP